VIRLWAILRRVLRRRDEWPEMHQRERLVAAMERRARHAR